MTTKKKTTANKKTSNKVTKIKATGKTLHFDAKAVEFLEKMRVKLKLKNIQDVIADSLDTLALLDQLSESGNNLFYSNEDGDLFPITFYDSEQNETVLDKLKNFKK